MKVLTNLLKFILIVVLAVCSIAIGIIQIVTQTVLNKNYIIQKMEETNFYSETYKLVQSNFEKYIEQSGFEENILENICTEEKVKQDINLMISNIYEGANKTIDITEISDNLNANIDKLNIRDSKNQKAIEQFVEHICQEYTDTLVHTKYENDINKFYKEIVIKKDKIEKIVIIAMVIDVIVILIVNNKNIEKDFQSIGTAIFSSSAFELIACQIINLRVSIKGIKIFNDAFSDMIVAIIQNVISKVVSFGIATLMIAIILIIINAIIIFFSIRKDERKREWKNYI